MNITKTPRECVDVIAERLEDFLFGEDKKDLSDEDRDKIREEASQILYLIIK